MAQDCTNPDCEGTAPIQTDLTAGQRICTGCYTIVESNLLVSEISFGETSGGRATVNGTFISNASTGKASMPGSRYPTQESSERVLANGNRGISNFASKMRLSGGVASGAGRIFQLAVNARFNRGRPAPMVWAACLYLQCRLSKSSQMMLIDFSEELQINVFELGATYLRLRKVIQLPVGTQLDVIDPSIYITRFATLLEFGDDMTKVAHDAMRLVRRFRDDWIVEGRRPAGICGACLVLAARMNNYRRSIEEVVQVVKIAEVTVRKRLDEFSQTMTGQMSVADFMAADLESMPLAPEPPAYIANKRREELKAEEDLMKSESASGAGSDDEDEASQPRKRVKASQGTLVPTKSSPSAARKSASPEEDPEDFTEELNEVGEEETQLSNRLANAKRRASVAEGARSGSAAPSKPVKKKEPDDVDRALNDNETTAKLVAEISASFNSRPAEEVRQELEAIEAAQHRRETGALEKHNDFADLDDDELEGYYMMDDEESATKARVWVSMNKDYLVKLSERQQKETEQAKFEANGGAPKRKRKAPVNTQRGPYASAGEAMKGLVQNNRKFSSRLNYAALEKLGAHDGVKNRSDSQSSRKPVIEAIREAEEPEATPEPEVPVLDDQEEVDDADVDVAAYDPNAVPDFVEEDDEDEEEFDE